MGDVTKQMAAQEISIRPATWADAEFVAWALSTAVGACMDGSAGTLIQMVQDEDTLYCWHSAWIATIDGEPVGAVIAYDGSYYAERRVKTFQMLRDLTGLDLTSQDDETQGGEFYIDTLAVLPAFRRQGIGRQLLQHCISEARTLGLTYASLAVHPDNLRAQTLYQSLGFVRADDIFIFGETYWKLRKPIPPFTNSVATKLSDYAPTLMPISPLNT